MKIDNDTLLTGINPQKNSGISRKSPGEGENSKVRDKSPDRVDLSMKKREIEQLKEKLAGLPDVRAERVAALRQQIEEGSYRVAGRDVAEKMLRGMRRSGEEGEGHE